MTDNVPRTARPSSLDGILIADFSRVLAGPYATMVLADLGAEVIKVEHPDGGDESRTWGPPWVDELSTYFLSVNRNKSSVTLDLRSEPGLRAARELVARADVVIENFRPGTMDRLGLGYEELSRTCPDLIYCAISGFGRGAGATLPGYDFVVQAAGGLMSITGHPGGEPTKVGVAVVDMVTGLFAIVGILAALRERDRSGRGQRVDLELLSCLLSVLVNQATGYLNTGVVPGLSGNVHPSIAPYETFETSSGEIVIAVGNQRQFLALVEVIGRADLASDERFSTNEARIENRMAFREQMRCALGHRAAGEWVQELQSVGVPAGRVNDLREAFAMAAGLGLDPIVDLPLSDGRSVRQTTNPLRLSGTPVCYRSAPSFLGEQTDEVLAWLDDDPVQRRAAGLERHRTT